MKEFVFGRHVVVELIRAGKRKINEILLLDSVLHDKNIVQALKQISVQPKVVLRKKLDDLSKNANHQGILAFVDPWQYTPLQDLIEQKPKVIVVCDSIMDPHNMGAIARAMKCFGMNGLIVNKDHSAPVSATVIKSSAGAIESLSVSQVTNISQTLDELKKAGYWVYAASLDGTESLPQIKWAEYSVIVLGNEGGGIRPLILKHSDILFKIPQVMGFDSLNVSQAASVIFYEVYNYSKKE